MSRIACIARTESIFMRRNLYLLFLAVAAAMVLGGCNTIEGAGKDLKKAGQKIEDAAKS